MTTQWTYQRRPRSRAVATVELAVVLPLVCLLLFGIVEFGLIFKDALVLQQAVREACRAAAVGATPDRIAAVLRRKAVALDPSAITISMQYRVWSGGYWSLWKPLGYSEDGLSNDAPPGAQIRVAARYPHSLVTGGLLAFLATDSTSSAITLSAASVVRRE